MIGVLLGQRGTLLRHALAHLLGRQPGIRVIAQAGSREDVLAAAADAGPHLVVLNHELPGEVDLSVLCQDLCRLLPDGRVLVVGEAQGCSSIGSAIAALGTRIGLIAVDSTPAELVAAVRALAAGEAVVAPQMAVATLTAMNNPLTPREQAVLWVARRGAPSKEIAAELFLSTGTVNNYLSRAMAKTGGRTRLEAVYIAQAAGWIEPDQCPSSSR